MREEIGLARGELSEQAIWNALQDVTDPEIPVLSVVDLGIINAVRLEGDRVVVEATPTFVGCPALRLIERALCERLQGVAGVREVRVVWRLDRPWSTGRITRRGWERLASVGIAEPPQAGGLQEAPTCPYCRSPDTELLNLFGPTACRSLFYCLACRNPFEGMKWVQVGDLPPASRKEDRRCGRDWFQAMPPKRSGR